MSTSPDAPGTPPAPPPRTSAPSSSSGAGRSRWAFLLVEAALIVASILLAFAIDTWWEGRQELRNQERLLHGFVQDLRGDSLTYASLLERYPLTVEAHRTLLATTTGGATTADREELAAALRRSIIVPILFDKETSTYREATAAGAFGRLGDAGELEVHLIGLTTCSDFWLEVLERQHEERGRVAGMVASALDGG